MAEIGGVLQSITQGIAEGVKGIFSAPAEDLPPDFTPVGETDLPAEFQVVKKPQRPIVGQTGVESPSAALESGQEFQQEYEARRTKRHDEILNIMGSTFNPHGRFDEGFWRQVDISRSGELSDKQRKFRLTFPDGDLISVPTSQGAVLLARKDKESPFNEVGLFPSFVGGLVSEPVIAGTVGSLFGPVGTFSATTLAVLAQTEIEKARGFGQGEPGASGALMEGGFAAAADLAMRGASRVVMGRVRTVAQQEAALRAILASEELGLEPIAAGQLAGPFGRGVFRQVAVTSARPEKIITNQELSLLRAFRELSGDASASLADDVLTDVVRAQQKELSGLLTLPSLSRTEAGEALTVGLETWKKASKRLADRWYDKARETGADVVYDLSPAQMVGKDIDIGVLGRGKQTAETVTSQLTDEFGQPFTREIITTRPVTLASTPAGQFKSAVDDLLALDPKMARFASQGKEFQAFEQIKTLRTRLFDLKSSDDPAVRREATRLWQSLRDVMEHPISPDPDFIDAYRKASALWRTREDTLEKTFVAQALRSDTPEAVARKYMSPNNATALATIRDLVPLPKFNEFRTGFFVDLMNSPTAGQAMTRLRNFRSIDPEGLSVLMNPREEAQLMKYLTIRDQFEKSPIRAVLSRKMMDSEKFVAVVKQGTVGEIDDAVRMGGGLNSEFSQNSRAGIYKSILDDATFTNKQGVEVVDSGKLLSQIDQWKKSGKLNAIFRPEDWRRLELFQAYSAPVSETADIGGAMMAGGLRQHAISVPMSTLMGRFEQIAGKVVKPLFQNEVTAWILSQPASYLRIAASSHKLPLEEGAVALAISLRSLERTQDVPLETQ